MKCAVALLAFSVVSGLVAADNRTLALSVGAAYRHNDHAKDVTDENGDFSWTEDYGYHVRLGSGAPSPGFIGWGSLDIDWARNTGNGDRLDSVGVLYVERIPMGPISLGLGMGSFYHDVHIASDRDQQWTIGGTATLSLDLFGPFFLEGGYNLTSLFGEKVEGLTMDYIFLDLGVKF